VSATSATLPPLLPPLDATAVLADLRAAAVFDEDPKARHLATTLRLTHASEAAVLARLVAICGRLEASQRAALVNFAAGRERAEDLDPWPLCGPLLWERLQALLHGAFRLEYGRGSRNWPIAMALWHGPAWLESAARLAQREAHRMRRPGGWRLPMTLPDFEGDRLVAELRINEPGPGEPAGEVLRLTWRSSAHLVAQSLPGRWSVIDGTLEPT
jgi:hypothetical protein